MSQLDATFAVTEPQHAGFLQADIERGAEWVTCKRCGRQWAIHGADAEVVAEGDGYCDEAVTEEDYD
jgi:hypothetical protein